jgi:hypothetical protein
LNLGSDGADLSIQKMGCGEKLLYLGLIGRPEGSLICREAKAAMATLAKAHDPAAGLFASLKGLMVCTPAFAAPDTPIVLGRFVAHARLRPRVCGRYD